jgi:hypothetical protein
MISRLWPESFIPGRRPPDQPGTGLGPITVRGGALAFAALFCRSFGDAGAGYSGHWRAAMVGKMAGHTKPSKTFFMQFTAFPELGVELVSSRPMSGRS